MIMPFGLKDVRANYQRLVDLLFREQKGRNVEVYVNDLLVKSKSLIQYIEDLREIFATLKKYNIRLNP